ncbi:MAG: flagellar hook assembly protein FlgD [Candidatus Binataceae bacterium]
MFGPVTPTTTPIDSAQSPSTASGAAQSSDALPSAQQFLQILLAEVKNQDPTSPTDPTQYLSEMTGFSELDQLSQINQKLAANTAASNVLQGAAAFIGRTITAPGAQIGVSNQQASAINYMPPSAGSYLAIITDALGNQVGKADLGSLAANAPQTFTWQVPSGTPSGLYTVSIGNTAGGQAPALSEQGVVQAVNVVNGSPVLEINGGLTIPASSVTSIGTGN